MFCSSFLKILYKQSQTFLVLNFKKTVILLYLPIFKENYLYQFLHLIAIYFEYLTYPLKSYDLLNIICEVFNLLSNISNIHLCKSLVQILFINMFNIFILIYLCTAHNLSILILTILTNLISNCFN